MLKVWRWLRIIEVALLLCLPAYGQYTLSPVGKLQFLGVDGKPLAGGFVYTYAAGTTSRLDTYQTASGPANQWPITLDSGGFANIWLPANTAYKFAVQNSLTIAQWTTDNISIASPSGVDLSSPPPIGNVTPNTGAFTTLTSTGGALNGTIGAGTPSTGAFTTVTALKVNGILNAAAYSGSDWTVATNVALAQAAAGATIDLRGFTSAQLAAPGTQTITVNLAGITFLFPGGGTAFVSNVCPAFDLLKGGVSFIGASEQQFGTSATILKAGTACSQGLISNVVAALHGADGTRIQDITLEGDHVGGNGYFAPLSYENKLVRVIAQNFTGAGVLIPNGTASLVDVRANNNGADGMVLGYDCQVSGGLTQANNNGGDGIHFVSGGCAVAGSTEYHNKLGGITIDGDLGGGWVASHAYVEPKIIIPDAGHNAGGYYYYSYQVGTSAGGGSEPSFCQSVGCSTTDNTVKWVNIGTGNAYGLGVGNEFNAVASRIGIVNSNPSGNNCDHPTGTCTTTGTGNWGNITLQGNSSRYVVYTTIDDTNTFASEVPGGPQAGVLCNYCSDVQITNTVFHGGAWDPGPNFDLGAVYVINSGNITIDNSNCYLSYGPCVTVDSPNTASHDIKIDHTSSHEGGMATAPNPYAVYVGAGTYYTTIDHLNAGDARGTPYQKYYFNSGNRTVIKNSYYTMSTASPTGGAVIPTEETYGVAGTLFYGAPAGAGYSWGLNGVDILGIGSTGVTITGVSQSTTLKVGGGVAITNSNALTQVGTPVVGQAACWTAVGPPPVIGHCTSVVGAGGACTCVP